MLKYFNPTRVLKLQYNYKQYSILSESIQKLKKMILTALNLNLQTYIKCVWCCSTQL